MKGITISRSIGCHSLQQKIKKTCEKNFAKDSKLRPPNHKLKSIQSNISAVKAGINDVFFAWHFYISGLSL